jgi:transcriptional regulator with XRE-family HTH domain
MPDEDPRAVIDELKRWCGGQYGRQSQIARQLGVSRQLVNDWLAGKAMPRIETWLKLKDFLGKESKSPPKEVRRRNT